MKITYSWWACLLWRNIFFS